ncbi:MAG: AmmeMemoRadiSam system radical SAM enzyme [Deltaproteobacteria bacterium]|nr:AmmeMemoRadiSam system radical SAM enzyme [Deltaproteobacteria bacterium]
MREAMFYGKKENKAVRCRLCAFNCTISEGKKGICRVRKNIDGTLYSLNYDKISVAQPDNVEKKPLYHFAPGSRAFSIATPGCNWRCKYCQNWDLSQGEIEGSSISPEEIVMKAKDEGCQGISYTYSEPTIFYELTYDTAKIAHREGLYNTYVTNGYMNPEPIREIAPYIDAVTVDFKGSGEKEFLREFSSVPDPEPIYRGLEEWRRLKVHIEITDLLVPQIGDSMKETKRLVEWIKENLGTETPIHFIRFFPHYLVLDLPQTPLETLEEAYEIAKRMGMKYVYIGNVYGEKNNTYCPRCGKLLVNRMGMKTLEYRIIDGKCPYCNEKIDIKGEKWIPKK